MNAVQLDGATLTHNTSTHAKQIINNYDVLSGRIPATHRRVRTATYSTSLLLPCIPQLHHVRYLKSVLQGTCDSGSCKAV